MSDYRNASFEELHAAEKNAERHPLRHTRIGVTVATMKAIPGAWEVVVPAEYVGEDAELEQVVVTCVCGREAHLEATLQPTPCDGGCGRWFLSDGDVVRVTKTSPDSSSP